MSSLLENTLNVVQRSIHIECNLMYLGANGVDLITCLMTLHHVPHSHPMVSELARVLKPGGYLIVREHDCDREDLLKTKYLHLIHAFLMIACIGEFSHLSIQSYENGNRMDIDWPTQKSRIIKYVNEIQYQTRNTRRKELQDVGFTLIAEYDYAPMSNPQAIYYDIFKLGCK
jgi:ubiquinone/menaquinone biosynthesis C-methylase UbiE